jgi:hypothetical protein
MRGPSRNLPDSPVFKLSIPGRGPAYAFNPPNPFVAVMSCVLLGLTIQTVVWWRRRRQWARHDASSASSDPATRDHCARRTRMLLRTQSARITKTWNK